MIKIYFDNAATTPLHAEVADKMYEVLKNDFGNPSSIHSYGRKTRSLIEDARKSVAKILNASIGEIFFMSSATEVNNMVLKRSIIDLGVKRIISSPTEHHCIIHTLDNIRKEYPGVEIILLNVNKHGEISLNELEDLLKENKKTLVSLMYGNNETGTIHDVQAISKICKEHNSYFHCDAVQMVGKYSINVQELQPSFLSATSHKFHGPKGSAVLYMNGSNIVQPFIYGGSQERNMRAGTENVAGIVGFAEALKIAHAAMSERKDKVSLLKNEFEARILNEIPDIIINGAEGEKCMYHISSISFPASPYADMLMMNLDIAGIAASSGSACSAGIEEDSHVLTAIGHDKNRKTIRFSFSYLNTIDEVDYVVEQLKKFSKGK